MSTTTTKPETKSIFFLHLLSATNQMPNKIIYCTAKEKQTKTGKHTFGQLNDNIFRCKGKHTGSE
jgi:hypothetical protein